jgi:hypothetical protein
MHNNSPTIMSTALTTDISHSDSKTNNLMVHAELPRDESE